MAIDPDLTDLVRQALSDTESVDARTIEVSSDADAIVLRGGVATYEEASAAVAIAQQHATLVRNDLRVDNNLREGLGDGEAPAHRPADTTGSATTEPDDLVDDMQESLSENVSWDPPHQPVEVPTRAEERGVAANGSDDGGDVDDAADDRGGTSLPDMSADQLSRAAHPRAHDEETA